MRWPKWFRSRKQPDSDFQTRAASEEEQRIFSLMKEAALGLSLRHGRQGRDSARIVDSQQCLSMALANPYSWGAASIIAKTCAQARIVFRPSGPNGLEDDNDPWLLRIKNPNRNLTYFELIRDTVMWIELVGNAYWAVDKSADFDGAPPIDWLYPTRVKVVADDRERIKEYIQIVQAEGTVQRKEIRWSPDEIIAFREFGPFDRNFGLPAQVPLRDVLIADEYATEWNIRFFKQGGNFQGVIEVDKPMLAKDYEEFRRQFAERVLGVENAHVPPVLQQGFHFQPTGTPPKDTEFIQGKKLNREAVAGMYGVPTAFLGDTSGMTYSTMQGLIEVFKGVTVCSRQRLIASAIEKFVRWETGNFDLDVSFDNEVIPLFKENPKQHAAWIVSYTRFGIITPNEGRIYLGKEPTRWGDIPLPILLANARLGEYSEVADDESTSPPTQPKKSIDDVAFTAVDPDIAIQALGIVPEDTLSNGVIAGMGV